MRVRDAPPGPGGWPPAAHSAGEAREGCLGPLLKAPPPTGTFAPAAANQCRSSSQRRRARPGGAREQKFSTSASAPRVFVLRFRT